jgi:DNA-directed RNA polymerase specialized sigma24 family protein
MPDKALSQQELMNNLVAGDQSAFGEIYDQLNVATFAICRHHLGSPDAVDEAMRGLWLYIWQNATMLAGLEGSPWSIIIATAEHHARYHARTESLAREHSVAQRAAFRERSVLGV